MNIMRFARNFILLLFVSLLFVSCGNESTNPNSNEATINAYPLGYPPPATNSSGYPVPQSLPTLSTDTIVEVVTPQPDKTTVTGIVQSERTGIPIMNIPVSLAEVYREGENAAYVLDGAQSPLAYTDKNGLFAFNNIPAGEYVVVIGSLEINDYIILTEESGQAKAWAATEGNTLDLGTQSVNLDTWQ